MFDSLFTIKLLNHSISNQSPINKKNLIIISNFVQKTDIKKLDKIKNTTGACSNGYKSDEIKKFLINLDSISTVSQKISNRKILSQQRLVNYFD